jgi:hypothetical protein
MADLTEKLIREIAENLDCGFDCFFNPMSQELITIPSFGEISDTEQLEAAFSEELKRIDQQQGEFLKFEVLESHDSFKIMERYTMRLSEGSLKTSLENALKERKPFRNFKYLIDDSSLREDWFEFKLNELKKMVVAKIKLIKG